MSTPASLISAETSPHFVPAKIVSEHKRTPPAPCAEWDVFLRDIALEIERENQAEEIMRIRKVVRNRHYYRGRQSGYFSITTGQYCDVEDEGIMYTKNIIRPLVKKRVAVWSNAKTQFTAYGRSGGQAARDGARMADKLAKYYQDVLFTERVKQREGKFVTLSGESFRYYYWSSDKGRLRDEIVWQDAEIQIGSETFACWNCETAGDAQPGMIGCPYCGSPNIALQPAPTALAKIPAGVRKVREGDLVLEIVDPLEIKMDLHARSLEESTYLRRRRLVRKEIMRAKFPRFELALSGGQDEMLLFQGQLESSPGNVSSATTGSTYAIARSSALNGIQFDQYWLDPVKYSEYVFPKDTPVGDGNDVIPKGTRALDIYPDGHYFALAGLVLIDGRPEDKNDHWKHLVDDLIPEACRGDSPIDDVIEVQDLINDAHSLEFERLMRTITPPLLYDKRLVEGSQLVNRPGENVPIQNRVPGERIEDSVYQIQPPPGDPSLDVFIGTMERWCVEAIGAYSENAAAPELKNGTATAAQLSHDQSMGLVAVPLALKAQADVETLEGMLRLIQKHWDAPRFIPLMGGHGMMEGEWFDAAKIPEDIGLEMADRSYMPRNETERRNDMGAAFNISPALPLGPYTPGLPPFLSRAIAERFNLDLDEDGEAAVLRLAIYKTNKIIALAKQAEEEFQGQPPEALQAAAMMILQQFPPNPRIDPPEAATQAITQWLLTDEGIQSSPFVQEILNQRIEQVEMGAVMKARQDQMKAAAADPMGMQAKAQQEQGGNGQQASPQSQGAMAG